MEGLLISMIKENLWALWFCLIVIGLIVLSSDSSTLWIYQGF